MTLSDKRIKLSVILLLLAVFWDSALILPLKLLVVFLHEVSHALATWLTGGSVNSFVVSANQSGHVLSSGGNRFIILSAGYLGSLLFGLMFYRLSQHNKSLNFALLILAGLLSVIAFMLAGSVYTAVFSIIVVGLLYLLYKYATLWLKQLVVIVFSCASLIYVPLDIWQDTIVNSGALSDANMLAREFGGTTWLWGGLWLGLSLYCIYLSFKVNK